MVVITHADARAYCLGIAQIIPVLMIALFVVDSSRFTQVAANTKRQVAKAVDILNTSVPEAVKKVQQVTSEQIDKLDGEISALDRIDRSQLDAETVGMLDATHEERVESRTRLAESLAGIIQLSASRGAKMTAIASREKDLDTAARKTALTYIYGVTLGIVLALAAEAIALWGAIGLMSATIAIACITDISVVLAATLARYAIERLIPIPSRYHVFNIVQYCWILAIIFAQFTWIWIVINVRVQ